jgi:hypothetical protein
VPVPNELLSNYYCQQAFDTTDYYANEESDGEENVESERTGPLGKPYRGVDAAAGLKGGEEGLSDEMLSQCVSTCCSCVWITLAVAVAIFFLILGVWIFGSA